MSKVQFLFTILATIILVVGALALANYYFDNRNIPPTNSTRLSENPPQPESSPELESIPTTIEGRVIGITDGDTVKLLTVENKRYVVRLAGIDAPERGQDFANKSKEYLSNLIFNRVVRVESSKIDRYGRSVGQIYSGGKDINLAIVKAGLAWHYKKYEAEQSERDRNLYAEAELIARKKRLRIWSKKNPTPPWEHRHPELIAP